MRELENEIATDVLWSEKPIPKVDFDTNVHPVDHHQRGNMSPFQQYLELVHLGLKHSRGQVFVVAPPMIDKMNLASLSYHGAGHQASNGDASAFDEMVAIESYIFETVSGFLSSLKESALFDDTIVLMMGSFCDPGRHSRQFIPAIVAGGGFNHQGIVECKDRYRLSQLYVSILHQMGIDVDEFSTFKGDLDEVLA